MSIGKDGKSLRRSVTNKVGVTSNELNVAEDTIHAIRCKRTGEALAMLQDGGSCVCPSPEQCRLQRPITREDAVRLATAQYEELSHNPTPELIQELRGKTTLQIAAALERSVQRLADAIMAEEAQR